MGIFILEDDVVQAYHLKHLIEELCSKELINYEVIEVTSRPNELLEKIVKTKAVPIYFLDLEIKGEERKGLEVAKEIRKIDANGIIVFITTHSELAPISYQYMVSALTFIDKNSPFEIKKEMIIACLKQFERKNQVEVKEDHFLLENEYTMIKVPFHTIEYVMTEEAHRLQMVITNQVIQFYGTLKDIENKDSRFIRCHQSYLVNGMQIARLDTSNQQIVLHSGKVVPVSRRLAKNVKEYMKGKNE